MSRVTDQIRRSRGDMTPQGMDRDGANSGDYEAFVLTEGFPQMAFSAFNRNGDRHVFFFHNIDNLDLKDLDDDLQYVKFTHRGKAVTFRGRGMHRLLDGFMAHTLQAIYEFHPDIYPPIGPGDDVVERLEVTDVNTVRPNKKEADS